MDALEAILTRRSTRKFRQEMPPREQIEKVLEAGRSAPSGHNSQTTHLLVIADPEILEELSVLVQNEFSVMEPGPDTYISMRNAIAASKKGQLVFHYHAPVLIVAANRKGYGNAMADSACALENMMIAANALDLGSCWCNQLHWLDENHAVRAYLEKLGLEQEETVTGALALGQPADGLPVRTPLPRSGNPVTWIEPHNS